MFITAAAEDVFQGELIAENPSSPTAPSATGGNAVAIGFDASAGGYRAFAAGRLAAAAGGAATAIGQQSLAFGNFSTALGSDSYSYGDYSIALGKGRANGIYSFAVQIDSASSSYGASGANSVAIGKLASAGGANSISLGRLASASGIQSIAIGDSLFSSGTSSIALGTDSSAASDYGCAIGYFSHTKDTIGKMVYASGRFSGTGDAQTGTFVLRSDTTDATPEALTTDNSAAGTTDQVILPDNSAYSFSGTIIARESAAAGSDYASWEIKGALLRDANAASTVLGNGIKNKLYASAGASAWDIALTADTTNGGLKIEVTGAASTNIRWVATVNTSEVTYA